MIFPPGSEGVTAPSVNSTAWHSKISFNLILGICLGLQIAVIEYARNVAGMHHANSTEFNQKTPFPVVALVTEWTKSDGGTVARGGDDDLGGTMRLGAQRASLKEGSKCAQIYGATDIYERHRHRYEVNNTFLADLEEKGLLVSGKSIDNLVGNRGV